MLFNKKGGQDLPIVITNAKTATALVTKLGYGPLSQSFLTNPSKAAALKF